MCFATCFPRLSFAVGFPCGFETVWGSGLGCRVVGFSVSKKV